MMIFVHFDCFCGGAFESVDVSIAGVCCEAYFMHMASIAGDCFSGYCSEAMAVSIVTAAAYFGTACDFVYVLSRVTGMSFFHY